MIVRVFYILLQILVFLLPFGSFVLICWYAYNHKKNKNDDKYNLMKICKKHIGKLKKTKTKDNE